MNTVIPLLGAFTKLRKWIISFVMLCQSDRLSSTMEYLGSY